MFAAKMLSASALFVFHMSLRLEVASGMRQQVSAEFSKNSSLQVENASSNATALSPEEAQTVLDLLSRQGHEGNATESSVGMPQEMLATGSVSFASTIARAASEFSGRGSARLKLLMASASSDSPDILTKLLTEPDFLLLVVYLVIFLVGGGKVYLQASSDSAEASAEVRAQRDALQGTYMSSVAEIEGILAGMSESSAYLAEWNFEEKRAKFEKFVERVRDRPDNFVESRDVAVAIVDPFRTYLSLWLSVYQQCTLDPLSRPKVIVEDKDMKKCRNLVDLSGLVADRLSKNSVTFIRAWVEKVRKQDHSFNPADLKDAPWFEFGKFGFGITRGGADAQRTAEHDYGDDDDSDMDDERYTNATVSMPVSRYPIDVRCGFVKLCVLSQTHGVLLVCFGLGFLVFLTQLVMGKTLNSVLVVMAQGVLATILYKIQDLEEVARLQHEINRLQYLSEEVRNNHDQLKEFYGKLRKLGHLWRYRTLPCLEHFHELHLALLNMKGPDKVAFLQAINDTWAPKLEGLGDVEDWMGEDSISEEFLKLASTQLNQATEYVVKHRGDEMASSLVLARVDQTFGFLVVRVLAGYNLTNKGPFGQTSNPYVILSVDQKGGNAMWKTKTVSGDLNPRWGEEYFIPISWSATILELHVRDDQRSDENASMGYCNIKFREITPGQWQSKRVHLWSERKQTQKGSEIMYEVFFANEVRQLREVDAPRDVGQSVSMGRL